MLYKIEFEYFFYYQKIMDLKNVGIIGTSFIAGVICSTIIYKYWKNGQKENKNKKIPSLSIINNTKNNYEQDSQYKLIKQQQLARIIKFFGEEKFKKLENSFVIVFGVGGVGSHVANMLARSGVHKIRVIDFDTVSMSSLNRHSFALREDVGTLKVQCLRKYIHKIFPHIQIQCVNVYATVDNVKELLLLNYQQILERLEGKKQFKDLSRENNLERIKPDYIIDCIDNLDAKVQLISSCISHKLKLIVSGGAGMKNDPTKIQIRDISDCKYDKLIMRLKRELTKKQIKTGVKVVFSYQQSEKELLPLTEVQEQNPHAYKVFDNYRIRIVPVLGTMPAIIGMTIASYVLCDLAGEPYQPFETDYVKSSSIAKLYNQLQYQIRRRGANIETFLKIDIEEASILAKKVYNWRCLINPDKKGERLAIWNRERPASIDNLALMCKQSYQKHIKLLKVQDGQYSEAVFKRFQEKSQYAMKLMESGFMMFI